MLAGLPVETIWHLKNAIDLGNNVALDFEGEQVDLAAGDLDLRADPIEGYAAESDGPHTLALETELTGELLAEGIAREVVRGVQDLRKSAGLAVEDRIVLWLASDDATISDALATHKDFIANEVLATEVNLEEGPADAATATVELDQGVVRVALRRA